ncbi:hypothetical protein GNIT_2997 [Glaciecola nitratireducens FR1064]|uniref:Uncharacterized protein n=1 Tax=Glaciecola nitratireducens (strain JCM 12485 / KCTC 12276 / FR1064) TaxID=1085623 RepID=G4QDR4_GLANF|nr:hypothetical protein GNIT_2997 [Glaciecola nitratireducens FR1064]
MIDFQATQITAVVKLNSHKMMLSNYSYPPWLQSIGYRIN